MQHGPCPDRVWPGSRLQVQKELEVYGDIVFVKEKTNYKSILFKTFFVRLSLMAIMPVIDVGGS